MALNSSSVKLSLRATQTGAVDLMTVGADLTRDAAIAFAAGTGTGKADMLFTDTRTLAASATEDLDLFGTLVDAFGATFSPAKIKALFILPAAANTNNVLVGGAAATQFASAFGSATDKQVIHPGGIWGFASPVGYAITSTTDLLKIANSAAGTSVTYDIIVIAASA